MTERRSRRSAGSLARWVAALALLSLSLGSGCSTPEGRHRWLSFFFDGVPPLGGLPLTGEPEGSGDERRQIAERSVVRAPEIFRHEPDCDECHTDRRAKSKRLIATADQICWECHDREDFEGEVVHGPFASNQCLECHSPHRSKFPSLLLRGGADLCGRCHDGENFPELTEHRAEHGEGCADCHDPHAADREFLLGEDDGGP